MRRTWTSVAGVVAVAAILIGLNMFAGRFLANAQLDLTQQGLYTLSPGTRTVVAGLKEPVTLRFYFSRSLGARIPSYGAYADRVRDMLREYARIGHGNIRLEFYDPEPFSDTEDRAVAYGLQGVPLDQGGEQVYFGLVGTNLLDDERIIAFLQPDRERFLEYDLTRLVYELSNPKRPVVGVMSSLPLDGDPRMMMMMRNSGGVGGPGAPYVSMLQLRQLDTVKTVPTDAQVIDPDVQVLLVAQAQNLSDATLYAIDQFVMRGGRLMVMVDPHSEAQAAQPGPTGMPSENTASNLAKLFDVWGITFDPKTVVGDLKGAWRVRAAPGDRVQAVDYVAWFNIRDGLNHDDPATADLEQVTVAAAGAIGKKDGAAITFTPLLSSSDQSGTIPVESVRAMPDPGKILGSFKPEGGPRVIAARVRGELASAFSAPPPLAEGQQRPAGFPEHKAHTDGPANLVVVGDSDILADRFWVRVQNFFGQQDATPFSDNGPFVANLIGTLAGGDALIGLRGRGTSQRPFDVVEDMQKAAEARFRRTEQALQTHLDETQKKLAELRTGRGGQATAAVITPEQRQAIDDLRREIADTRNKLRAVQFDLRRDIAGLETRLRLIDILLVPAILTGLAVARGIARRRRRPARA
ncbi:gliding motility protein GldG [Rhodovastum atsumiense]|uniref:ABC transporter n=1 Tax=Rhodovastum atsumiense TaxID=504468 RepID=A0A5M6IPB8_9PROT|nr:Gldg family protein [Rhodovastum atsumiense]KAA5609305.1 ABC transporter [Rhodovastum atsumiense]CAH2604621.1 gliding motility protein GldG [Rhodovastum atsumiense]